MRILVTGGCGYKGTVLVPKLLSLGHEVLVIDTQWFGNHLNKHEKLKILKKDIRVIDDLDLTGFDSIIHLASVANDPCGDLNPKLTWEVNALATETLANKAARSGVKQFIYASSGSVYGVSDEAQVTEDLMLKPISDYNKTKMVAERILLSYQDKMSVQIIRPATVCGYSKRMRLDVSVNMLTMQALTKKSISVFGGNQTRPNIHIDDITDLYCFLLEKPNLTGIYNAGFENISILDLAKLVQEKSYAEIRITDSNDPRSYRVNSDKILSKGFAPKKTIKHAVDEIIALFEDKVLLDLDRYYNLKTMKSTNVR